jgi:Protein of unknown function (DUF3182)
MSMARGVIVVYFSRLAGRGAITTSDKASALESSRRAGGASSAELAALAAFAKDPALQLIEASAVEELAQTAKLRRMRSFISEAKIPRRGRCSDIRL